jgi:hypothetical protein
MMLYFNDGSFDAHHSSTEVARGFQAVDVLRQLGK